MLFFLLDVFTFLSGVFTIEKEIGRLAGVPHTVVIMQVQESTTQLYLFLCGYVHTRHIPHPVAFNSPQVSLSGYISAGTDKRKAPPFRSINTSSTYIPSTNNSQALCEVSVDFIIVFLHSSKLSHVFCAQAAPGYCSSSRICWR